MTYYTISKEGMEDAQRDYEAKYPKGQTYTYSLERDNYTYEMEIAHAIPMGCKKKADLVKEGAIILERMGETAGFILNIAKDKRHGYYYHSQQWYIFKEDGQWFFKMGENVKTKHLIEGVVA